MWLQDTGVLDKIKYDVLKPPMLRPLQKVWKDEPLNLYQLEIIMIVLVFGMVLSILVFLFELRQTKKKKTESSRSKSLTGLHEGEKGSIKRDQMIELRIEGEMDKRGGNVEREIEHIEVVEEEIVSLPRVLL